ncbi:surface antigen BspA-like [Trichomonas vaginalis G3]|uniref:Surface antigen BspA-like n=1 Tax=Trichomonas vaginalis (strain ATCC PRA-98 / G3) TaxID=412133 RepID=A2EVT6_TRIV3|nr:antigen BSP-related family [Trichomonas vaginalis G3]EAY03223.1 surface antigen BspA-like [Trichomonas vaginalis G3]KAI5550821.1 antigen BSP-related family [Trichomonas vaginalis G3]|eukprot:XP_001315446.1 surface antigen BspA-like [Trichomonas vaginalis G3]
MNSSITEINLENVEVIDANAFYRCFKLQKVHLLRLSSVSDYIFANSALRSIVIGDSLFEIGKYFAAYCFSLESVTIGANVQIVNDGAFDSCINLTYFELQSITTIGQYAFQGTGLPTLELTDKIVRIGNYAFSQSSITKIVFNPNITSCLLGKYCFYRCQRIRFISIPSNYILGDYLLSECMNLESIELGNPIVPIYFAAGCISLKKFICENLTRVRQYSFSMCGNLTSINLSKVVQIEKSSFEYCVSLVVSEWPKVRAMVILGNNAFQYCKSLKITEIPPNYNIFNGLFLGCSSIEEVNVEVSSLQQYLFMACTSLKRVNCSQVTFIINNCFSYCTSLEEVYFANLTIIRPYSFLNAGPIKFMEIPPKAALYQDSFRNSGIKVVKMLDQPYFYGMPFLNCTNLEKIILGPTWTYFEAFRFTNCTKLSTIEIIENTNLTTYNNMLFNTQKTILYYFFDQTENLELQIPSTVINIRPNAFINARNLQKVTISNYVAFSDFSFNGCLSLEKFVYETTSTPDFNPDTMYDFIFDINLSSNMFSNCKNLKEVEISADILSIGSYCFANCSELKTIDFPESCRMCGEGCFCNCSKLNKINFTQFCHISDFCFMGCTELSKIELSETIVVIGQSAFQETAIKNFDVPDSTIEIGNLCFKNCQKLKKVVLGAGITSLPGLDKDGKYIGLFYGSSIKTLMIPNTTVDISPCAFVNCRNINLKFISKEHPLYRIEGQALIDKSSSTLITTFGELPRVYEIPDTVTTLGSYSINPYIEPVFVNGNKVFDAGNGSPVILIPKSVKIINKDSFYGNTYMYTICYDGDYVQSNELDNDLAQNFYVKDNYGSPKIFGADAKVEKCNKYIPDQLRYRFISGWSIYEIVLLVISIVLFLALVGILIAILVVYCKKRKMKNEGME